MNKKRSLVTWIILIAGLILIAVSGWNLYRILRDYHDSNEVYSEMEEKYVVVKEPQQHEDEAEIPWYEMASVDLAGVQAENSDVIGWLFFENEDLSYPILFSGEDDRYLHTAVDGSSAKAGSIFMEGANTPDFEDSHTIIYGHNMRNLSMFGKLKYYKAQEDYYEDHMYFQIIRNDVIYRYQIFAYEDVSVDSFVYEIPFAPNADFAAFIKKLYNASYRDTGVTATEDDKIITLSTCSTEDHRFVVHAVRVDSHRIGEES
jgi:sortase B